jgi:hypothetical protein
METGTEKSGLQHLMSARCAGSFAGAGVKAEDIVGVVFDAVIHSTPIGISGEDRVVFVTTHQGRELRIAVSVASNGYIVGANPVHHTRKLKPLP